MKAKALVALLATLSTVPAMAAQIMMHTLQNGVLTGWSLHSVNQNGIYRIDEGAFITEASVSELSSGGVKTTHRMGPTRSTTVIDKKSGKIAEIGKNRHCRVLSRDSQIPGGMDEMMGGADMQQHRQQMAQAAAGANARIDQVIAEMKANGATPEQIAMVANIQSAMGGAVAPQAQNDETLQLRPLNSSVDFNGLDAKEFMAVSAAGEPRFRFAVVDIDDLPGAGPIKEGILWTIETYQSIMQNAVGSSGPLGDSFTAVMKEPQLKKSFPVIINELRESEVNKVISATKDDKVEVQYTDLCDTESDMFEM
ncbi:MAG: hypothetical protein KJO31_04345 [Gammaproteobacteria bacterium]|nr:hypothetical protein [Gammaproteobacteria bacterium]